MFSIKRKKRQRVYVDGPCVVKVQKIKQHAVQLGIAADRHVKIRRGESIGNPERPSYKCLVLNRESQQSIRVYGPSIIDISDIRTGPCARIAILADATTKILRTEVKDHEIDIQTFDEWMDEWEAAVSAGQTSIPRSEAIKRYHKYRDENGVEQ